MFRYGTTNANAIKLKLFPSSLTADAKVRFNELSPRVIATWEQMRQAFVSKFFPPAMFDRLVGEIQGFTQHPNESLVDAWQRMKDLLRSFHVHGLGRGTIIQIFYHGLDEATQAILDSVTTRRWDVPKMKKQTMPTEVIEEEDIEETTTVGIPEDEVDEAEKEVEPSSSKQTKSDPPPLKAYKPKIPYPQRLCKEKMEDRYAKFIDLMKEVKINVPLVDVLAGMPNYGKFDGVNPCCLLKQRMLFRKFVFLTDFVILQMEEDDKVPLILGRPFLYTVDAIIRVKNKELNQGVGDDRITFLIDKAIRHSHYNDDTCFRVDVIEEVTKEELDELLDDSKPFSTMSEKISESSLDHEFEEFMAIKIKEIPEQGEEVENSFKVLPLEGN
ncbi:reverse transcriptase domain-containing protein [Tanacetum coccineum]|uniref:Reverse transcriptase domain-containing protein n=1 Tax=Tanacetum coccineum TaxID=301880 RepID=A0ABQ5DFQ6_9ASTR